jgi:hypothetical protein
MDDEFDFTVEDSEQPKPNHTASSDFKSEDKRRSPFFGERRKRVKKEIPKAVVAIPNRKGQFVEPLTKLYAETLDQLAYENEAARKAIWMLTQTSTLGMVFVAHMPILMAVLMHHVPRMQEAFGAMGANVMEEFLKQTAPGTESS